MNGDAIQVVTRALRSLLEEALSVQSIPGGIYVGPLDDSDATNAAGVLFLFRVAPSADLRNRLHERLGPDGMPQRIDRALPLELHYLLTGGTSETGGELDAGLRVLGFLMQALNDQPELVGLAVEGETVRITLEPASSEELSRIWTLFPNANYRTSVVYVASPVWIDPLAVAAAPALVAQEEQRWGQREVVQ